MIRTRNLAPPLFTVDRRDSNSTATEHEQPHHEESDQQPPRADMFALQPSDRAPAQVSEYDRPAAERFTQPTIQTPPTAAPAHPVQQPAPIAAVDEVELSDADEMVGIFSDQPGTAEWVAMMTDALDATDGEAWYVLLQTTIGIRRWLVEKLSQGVVRVLALIGPVAIWGDENYGAKNGDD